MFFGTSTPTMQELQIAFELKFHPLFPTCLPHLPHLNTFRSTHLQFIQRESCNSHHSVQRRWRRISCFATANATLTQWWTGFFPLVHVQRKLFNCECATPPVDAHLSFGIPEIQIQSLCDILHVIVWEIYVSRFNTFFLKCSKSPVLLQLETVKDFPFRTLGVAWVNLESRIPSVSEAQ